MHQQWVRNELYVVIARPQAKYTRATSNFQQAASLSMQYLENVILFLYAF